MTQLISFINSLPEDTSVIYSNKYGNKNSNIYNLKDVITYDGGSLVKNFSLISGRILAGGRLYKIIK